MEKSNKEIIKDAIGNTEIGLYLSAEFGENAAVYADGRFFVGQDAGFEISPDERPIAIVACPGASNIDPERYAADFATHNHETGMWTINEAGEEVSLEKMIRLSCEDGELVDEIDELIEALTEDLKDN